MDELTIGDKIYISSKRAAAITGYAKDYVGQLCREGHVEAKMVGRSWYVLESSIRAHRFGQSEPEQGQHTEDSGSEETVAENASEAAVARKESGASIQIGGGRREAWSGTWETPKYVAEEAPAMPELMPDPTPAPAISEARETPQSLDMSEDRESLTEMQAAWREWFESKQEPVPAPTEAFEEAAEQEPADEPEAVQEIVPEPSEEPVPVAVHRIPEPPRPAYVKIPPKPVMQPPARSEMPQKAGKVIIREKRVRKASSGPANLVHIALLVAVGLIVIAIGVIGSGFADTYLGSNPVIKYLGGTSSINKQ